ncbi:DUF4350 domain-containing protein [Colwellia psychrerythraea]|uniref:DUF4350 domain-containing protein n=1 Tax=Colwellia psychrerythraea TaxID=28229 RepID=A0A099K9L9_COLPS|nr:DUF4350 domain-containing protein [Colwellia psychrerythraea]KGJ86752.1 hypothetical protein ND2E_0924 [Colwellia psychrerythraea]
MVKLLSSLIIFISLSIHAQQLGDTSFTPKNTTRTFSATQSPVVLLDEAHHNFHTMDGRYRPFVDILKSDGYSVEQNKTRFTKDSLSHADILIISNALHSNNIENWDLPNYSAFSREEIKAVYHWVKNGGSLFLIADHMPFPKAAEDMAAIFGFQFNNGYVEEVTNKAQLFEVNKGTLLEHPILKGAGITEEITSVKAFTGQAFLSPPDAKPLLVFADSAISYMPTKSWEFPADTPEIPVKGWNQGATLEFDKGRVVVFGEAAMFTAQVSGKEKIKMGVIAKGAEQNEQFLLNIMLWLSRKI